MTNSKIVMDFNAADQKELLETTAKRYTYLDLLYIQKSGNQKTETKDISVQAELKNAVSAALQGKSGTVEYTDKNEKYLGSYSSIKVPGNSSSWAVIVVDQESVTMSSLASIRSRTIMDAGVILLIALIMFQM